MEDWRLVVQAAGDTVKRSTYSTLFWEEFLVISAFDIREEDTKIVMTKINIGRALGVVNALDPAQDLVNMIIIAGREEIEALRTAVVMTTDVAMRTIDVIDLVTTNEATVKESATMTEIMTDTMKTGIVRETERGAGRNIETAVANVVATAVANVVENEKATDTVIVTELTAVAPSATVCLKGLAAETEEGQIAALIEQYVPLRHARVIRDRTTGVSRGFAFLDFPSVDVARQLMESNTRFKLELGGQRLFLEYSRVATAE
eukprot:gene10332-12218_t